MPKQVVSADRNFDDLAERFDRNIYGGLKGRIRLAVLQRDFTDFLPVAPYVPLTPGKTLRILDAGGGQGHFSIPLAGAGHSLTLCDISSRMLERARQRAQAASAEGQVVFYQGSAQSLTATEPYDLVLCHALLEWVVEPFELFAHLSRLVRPGGHLSLIFYNRHSLVYKNLLRGNYKKVLESDYGAYRGSLTPINPLVPEDVTEQCRALGLEMLCYSGIRVFHDYILDPAQRVREPGALLAMELAHSRQQPFRALGRYIHFMLRKT